MKKVHAAIFVTFLALLLSSFPSAAQSASDALRSADQAWLKVFAAKNLGGTVAFCTEDSAVLAPNAPIAKGKAAIGKLFSGYLAMPDVKVNWRPDRVDVAASGELGYTSGAYEMSFRDPTGQPISDKGKYVTVWKKQADGSWKVLLDIFNSDLPANGPI